MLMDGDAARDVAISNPSDLNSAGWGDLKGIVDCGQTLHENCKEILQSMQAKDLRFSGVLSWADYEMEQKSKSLKPSNFQDSKLNS